MPVVANDFNYGPTASTLIQESAAQTSDPLTSLGNSAANVLNKLAGVPTPAGGVTPISGLNPLAGVSSLFFGTRLVAIVLGLIFIFGAILLFTGESIGSAVARIAPETV